MTTLPTSMIAIDPSEAGGPQVLKPVERPVPSPSPGELLIRVAAAGVNRPDVMQREGKYPPPPGASSILGLELAGEVVAGDAGWIGRKVCALVAGGAYAQYAVAPVGQCLPVSDSMTMIEAAALPETLFTVWGNLFHRVGAKAGDSILLHGGTSGIGTMTILLGKVFGLSVTITAGSAEKCRRALEIGAAHAINYKDQDFVAEVKARGGVDIVLDMVGGDYLGRNLDCLREEGRHVSIATQRGPVAELPIWAVMRKRLTLTGTTLRARDLAFKSALRAEIEEKVWPHVCAGALRPVIDSTFPLTEARAAHARLEAGEHVGKIVLTIE
ncbi:MAG TPA: NAD(P)H-quinone oxidoreductase [Sphingomonas sp.]|nr:NAD(P)H-quinone oxidoreductase [Sphingomonas sp.]